MNHKNVLLAVVLNSYRVRRDEEVRRLRAENERIRGILVGYRIREQIEGKGNEDNT